MEPSIKRYAIIIGAMKSGTTSLFDYIAQHPQICPSANKEPAFFADEDRWRQGLEWYESFFAFDPARHEWALEGSTDYTKRPDVGGVIDRMAQIPDVEYKFIYVMRNPLRRIESHVRWASYMKLQGRNRKYDRADWSLDGGIEPFVVNASRYAYQLEPYFRHFGRDSVHLITLEGLQANPQQTLTGIFSFLGLEPFEADAGEKQNTRDSVRSARRSFDRLRAIAPLRGLYQAALPKKFRHMVWQALSIPASEYGRFDLTPEEEAEMINELRDDLRVVSKDFGVDVERLWGIPLDRPAPRSPTSAVKQ